MAIRLNAKDANRASKQAKTELAEEKLYWGEQKNILIDAACAGDFECTTSKLYHPRILRAHGFQISVGQVIVKKMSDVSFDKEKVNDDNTMVRGNRLKLLSRIRSGLDGVADFSKIEG